MQISEVFEKIFTDLRFTNRKLCQRNENLAAENFILRLLSFIFINDLRLQNLELTTDLTTIKKSVFTLIKRFGLINEQGEIQKPSKLKLVKQIMGVVADAFDGNENLFSDIVTHVAPLATKYRHL